MTKSIIFNRKGVAAPVRYFHKGSVSQLKIDRGVFRADSVYNMQCLFVCGVLCLCHWPGPGTTSTGDFCSKIVFYAGFFIVNQELC